MNTELTEHLDNELNKLDYIEVIRKEVDFTNTEINGEPTVSYDVTVLPKKTDLSEEELKKAVIDHLKKNLTYQDGNIHEVYLINVAEE